MVMMFFIRSGMSYETMNEDIYPCLSQEKSVKEPLELEAKRFSFIINQTPTLIGYWNKQLINEFSNAAYSRWFNQSPFEIKGKHLSQVLGEELYNTLLPEIFGVLEGKEQRFDRYITNDTTGEEIHTLTRYFPDIENNKVIGFYVIGVDITDKEQLKNKKIQFDTLVNSLNKGVVFTDNNQQIRYVNKAFERLTGYSLSELFGKDCNILNGANSDLAEIHNIRKAIKSRTNYQCEIVSYRKDGTEFWNELNVNPIFDNQGKLSQYIYFHQNIGSRKTLEYELITSENQFRSLANAAPVLIWLAGLDKLCYWFNETWLNFTGRTMEQENGNGWAEGVHPEDLDRCLEIYVTHFDKRLPFRMEYRLRRYDGEYRWIDDHGVPSFNPQGEFEGYIGSCTDVTDIRNSKTASDFFNVSHEIIYSTDLKGIILDVNSRFLAITGYSREEVIGCHIKILKSGAQDEDFYTQMWDSINNTGFWSGEITNKNKNNQYYSAITSISTIRDNSGQPIRYLAIASDITTIVESRDQLKKIAFYDNLTQLPNRALLIDRLEQVMARINREGGLLSILFIDLDGFKQINDNYGHDMGDKVLIIVSQRMQAVLRKTDTIARLGGDEFIVLLSELSEKDLGKTPINHLLQACSDPIIEEKVALCVSASIGVALYSNHSAHQNLDSNALIKQADQAMYIAKQAGKNCYHYFEA
jgi:diguanylate cyclase (GGDEF)-like protein/PAS domain S-box-containing protein